MKNIKEIQDEVVTRLTLRNHIIRIHPNGHIKINRWNYWCTSEKWRNEITGEIGIGFKSFVEAVERKDESK